MEKKKNRQLAPAPTEYDYSVIPDAAMLVLRNIVIFPGMVMHFNVGRKKSIAALNEAMEKDQLIFLAAQTDITDDDPSFENVFSMGVYARIRHVMKAPGNNIRVMAEGICRAVSLEQVSDTPYMRARIQTMTPKPEANSPEDPLKTAMLREIKEGLEEYIQCLPNLSEDIVMKAAACEDLGELCDHLAFNLMLGYQDKQAILDEADVFNRGGVLLEILSRETELLDLENSIHERVRSTMDKHQKEYYLREQVKAIQNELGDSGDNPQLSADSFTGTINAIKNISAESREKLLKEADKLSHMQPYSAESTVVSSYLSTVTELPWDAKSRENGDIKKAARILDRDHYGLKKVKERILEHLAVHTIAKKTGTVICFIGPPGVGKTSVAESVARAMGRKFVRVSLGGVRDEAEIRGHRKTYIGAMPGRIITAIKQSGVSNPVILLDEIEKMGMDVKGDPASALLEVLDMEQNKEFRDHYVEIPFDLSDVFFIATANTADTIAPPLYDRMEIVEIPSYTHEEKVQITKKHLIPKQLKFHGLDKGSIKFSPSAIDDIIEYYTSEAGVRTLERMITSICRKCARRMLEENAAELKITSADLRDYLGVRRYIREDDHISEPGVADGLAWTSVGGVMLTIEANVMEGSGKLELTGSLGTVMQESAKAALSFIRNNALKLGVDPDFYKNRDIHIHVPEGATPKDGPSAGITMASALISAFKNQPLPSDVAMTGEITLRGRVLAIGGLREKSMAAYRDKKRRIIIPKNNMKDLDEIDDKVKEALRFIPVSSMNEVIALLFPENGGQNG